jgi:hypothetical protein
MIELVSRRENCRIFCGHWSSLVLNHFPLFDVCIAT